MDAQLSSLTIILCNMIEKFHLEELVVQLQEQVDECEAEILRMEKRHADELQEAYPTF
jgi:hypothetical protein